MGSNISQVTVYQFEVYDVQNDVMRRSARWGTPEAIEKIGGFVLPDTAKSVPLTAIDSDIPGLTKKGFTP